MTITTVNTDELTIATEAITLEVKGTKVEIDMVGLMKLPVGSEDCWIDISPLMKLKGEKCLPSEWLRLPTVKKFIAIKYRNSKFGKIPYLNADHSIGISSELLTNSKVLPYYPLINRRPVVDVKKGRYGGTWIHRDLLTKFATWISVEFEVAMHETFMDMLRNVNTIKVERESTKDRFHGLVEVIDSIYAPSQSSYQEQSRHKLMDMINIIIIGMSSRKFRKLHDIEEGDIRDYMNEPTLNAITKVEEDMKGFIEYGMVVDYNELKDKLRSRHEVRVDYLKRF